MGSELLFVNGTLMRGLKLHANLDGAEFVEEARTAPTYRIHTIGDIHPGMYMVPEGGVSVAGEIYRVPDAVWRRVEAGEPPGCTAVRSASTTAGSCRESSFLASWPRPTRTSPSTAAGERTGPRARRRVARPELDVDLIRRSSTDRWHGSSRSDRVGSVDG